MRINNLNILYISHESELGGAPRSLVEMLDCLREYIHPVVIIPRNGSLEELLIERNIKYYIVPFMIGCAEIGHHSQKDLDIVYADNIRAAHKISQIIRENNIQLVHSNSVVVDVGVISSTLSDKPHLWHLREFCEEDFGIEFLDQEWKKLLFSTSDFFSISHSVRDKYYQKYLLESSMAIDYMNVNTIKRNNSPFTKDIIKIIIVGNIIPGKGQFDSVKAVNTLIGRNIHNIRLIIIGNGAPNYIWSINKYIECWNLEKYIKILPYTNNINEIRQECDVSLTCSRMEGLGRVTIEAMASGITVIGADTGGTKELIGENKERGYLYEQGNFLDLADKIELVLKDKQYREIKRKKAYDYIIEKIDPNSYANKILETYEKCINTYSNKSLYVERVKDYISTNRKIIESNNRSNEIKAMDLTHNKFKKMFFMAEKWLQIHHKGYTVGDFIRRYGYQSVAIYGFGYLGRRLYDELSREHINISYLIDKADFYAYEWVEFLKPENPLPPVDVIIVTVSIGDDEIVEKIESKYLYKVTSLSNILDELLIADTR